MIEKDCEQEVCGLRETIMSRSRYFRDGFQNGLKFWFDHTIFLVFLSKSGRTSQIWIQSSYAPEHSHGFAVWKQLLCILFLDILNGSI